MRTLLRREWFPSRSFPSNAMRLSGLSGRFLRPYPKGKSWTKVQNISQNMSVLARSSSPFGLPSGPNGPHGAGTVFPGRFCGGGFAGRFFEVGGLPGWSGRGGFLDGGGRFFSTGSGPSSLYFSDEIVFLYSGTPPIYRGGRQSSCRSRGGPPNYGKGAIRHVRFRG